MSSKKNNMRSLKFYRKNEEEVMKRFGLIPTKNSGAGWIEKEDGMNEYLIAQLKSTDAESIRIGQKDLHTLEYNAIVAHKIPIFMIQFLQDDEVFLVVKPSDISSVAQYLNTGSCNINRAELPVSTEEMEVQDVKVIKSSSKGRESFYKEKEKEQSKWRRR